MSEQLDFRQRWLPQLLPLTVMFIFLWQGGVTLYQHEPWRDEAQAWLIARDASLATLFELRPFEARPAVWDLLLVPLAKAGLPMFSGQLLHLALAAGMLGLVFWQAPFHWSFKLLFAFSYFPFWEYSMVMRIYGPCVFWLFCLAALYPRRFQYPLLFACLVGLLFNTSVHAFFLAGTITLLFVMDALRERVRNPRVVVAFVLMVLSAVACLAQIRMPSDHPHIIRGSFHKQFDYTQLVRAVAYSFASGSEANLLTVVWGAACLALTCLVFLPRWPLLLITVANVSGLFYIFGRMGSGIRQHGLIPLGILFCLWIAPTYASAWPRWSDFRLPAWFSGARGRWVVTAILGFSFLISIPATLRMHWTERQADYSGAFRMAQYLRTQQLDRGTIAAFPSAHSLAILPYLPRLRFWFPGIQEYGTYVQQDLNRELGEEMTTAEAIQRVRTKFPQEEPLLMILLEPPETMDASECRLLFRADTTVFGSDEKLFLYSLQRPARQTTVANKHAR